MANFKVLANKIKANQKLPNPARVQKLEVLKRILDGTIYDVQSYQFHEEIDASKKRIPIADRAPSVDAGIGLIQTTVNHTISFVFGEGRFPELDADDDQTKESLSDLIKETNLMQVMQTAMYQGSVGSVVILMRISEKNRPHFSVMSTQHLTPTWNDDEPDELTQIQERYIVTGQQLIDLGYKIDPVNARQEYFFQRIWTDMEEQWFIPWPVITNDPDITPQIDTKRSRHHVLGFVPAVWIKNLKGQDPADIDGNSTFGSAVKLCVEMDYLISQGNRGLKYQADPTLVIINPNAPDDEIYKSASTALVLGADGDAKLLEMKGGAHSALLEQVSALREAALEAMGGNRASPDKLQAAQSGAALELLWQQMIMLASDLRNSYGEQGLLQLLKLVIKVGSERQLQIFQELVPKMNAKVKLSLTWPPYFEPTEPDKQAQATTLISLVTGGLMSKPTALQILSANYDIDDIDDELKNIETDNTNAMNQRVDEAGQVAKVTAIAKPPTKG